MQSRWTRNRPSRLGDEWHDLKPARNKTGHLRVRLGKGCDRYVHILVLEAFVGPRPEGMEACHYPDRNPANNNLSNLKWGTHKENTSHSIEHGTFGLRIGNPLGESHPNSKLTESAVKGAMSVRENLGYGPLKICRSLGIDPKLCGAINAVLRGCSWNHVTGLPPCQCSHRNKKSGAKTPEMPSQWKDGVPTTTFPERGN